MKPFNIRLYLENVRLFFKDNIPLQIKLYKATPDALLSVKFDGEDPIPYYRQNPLYSNSNPKKEWSLLQSALDNLGANSVVGVVGFNFGYELDHKFSYQVFEPLLSHLNFALGYRDFSEFQEKLTFLNDLDELIKGPCKIIIVSAFVTAECPEIVSKLRSSRKIFFQIKGRSDNPLVNQHVRSTTRLPDLRVLVQARGDLHVNHGGDTVALESSVDALRKLGVMVDVDINQAKNPSDYDLVHLYNFATPNAIEPLGVAAVDKGVPVVVTTLYEDRDKFFIQMHIYASAILAYVRSGYKGTWGSLQKASSFKDYGIRFKK